MTPGPLALVGSGEFLPAMTIVDQVLLEGRPRRVAVLPTAAAPEGPSSVGRWFGLARQHYRGLGADVVEVDVRDRSDADDPELAALLEGCGLIYLSGGSPGYLADTLRATAVARRVSAMWQAGAALAGCSAGAMALGRRTIQVRGGTVEGLGLAGPLVTIPHYDRFGFGHRLAAVAGSLIGAGDTVVGVDEETAVVWHPEGTPTGRWRVAGRAKAWLLTSDGSPGEGYADGDDIPLPPPGP